MEPLDLVYLLAVGAAILIGGFAALVAIIVLLSYGLVGGFALLFTLPYLPAMARNRAALKAMPSFKPRFRYVRGTGAIALDPDSRKVFLADGRYRKFYDVAERRRVDLEKSDEGLTLRVAVNDLQHPLFEVPAFMLGGKQLREIESALSILQAGKRTKVKRGKRAGKTAAQAQST